MFNLLTFMHMMHCNEIKFSIALICVFSPSRHFTFKWWILWTTLYIYKKIKMAKWVCVFMYVCMCCCCFWVTTGAWGWSSKALELRVEGGRVSHSWCMCVVVMAMVGWMGQGWNWCLVGMQDKARGLVACQKMTEYILSVRWLTGDSRSHHHPGAQFWVGSSRKGLTRDATRRFLVHTAGWLHSIVLHRCILMHVWMYISISVIVLCIMCQYLYEGINVHVCIYLCVYVYANKLVYM